MSANSTPGKSKTMSSRLLTMKFMQRAAASTVDEPETPSPKRRRLSKTETPKSDLEAVNAALAAEEQKRAEAVARQAAEAGETNWVMDFSANPAASSVSASSSQPMIVAADSLDAENEATVSSGRKSYGGFQRKKPVPVVQHVEEDTTSKKDSKDGKKGNKGKKSKKNQEEMPTSISGGRGR